MRTTTFTLCCLVLMNMPAQAHDFSWDTMVRALVRMESNFDYDANVDSWMQVYRQDVWKRYHEDEFALEEKRQQTIDMMKRAVETFDLKEDIVLQTRLELGKYDFKQNAFPIRNLATSNYWYTDYRSNHGSLPSRFRIYLSNPEMLQSLPMVKDAARNFVNRRKSRYGSVNRTVQATLKVRIKRLKSTRGEFLVEVQSARLYDDTGRTRLLHDFRKPARKTEASRAGSPHKSRKTTTAG